MRRITTANLTHAAMMTAVTCVLAQVIVPIPLVPITLQAFAIALCGYMLGAKGALVSVGAYLALGFVGAPVFAGFSGGLQRLASPTGGFLIGFLPMAFLCGLGVKKSFWQAVLLGLAGLVLLNVVGVLWLWKVANLTFWAAVTTGAAPFIIKDALLVVAASVLGREIRKRLGARFL